MINSPFKSNETKIVEYEDEFTKVRIKYVYDKTGLLISSQEIERIILSIRPDVKKDCYIFVTINDEVKARFKNEIRILIEDSNQQRKNLIIKYIGNDIYDTDSNNITFDNIKLSKIVNNVQKSNCDIFLFVPYLDIELPNNNNWFVYSLKEPKTTIHVKNMLKTNKI